ncbi:MAG: membrane protein insertase YidC, partial [Nitrospinales bacterium]
MESRALIAFILSLGVFIGWGFVLTILNPPPENGEPRPSAKTTPPAQPAPPGRVEAPAPEPMTPPQPAPSVEQEARFPGNEVLVHFDNKVMALELSNKGGVIKKALMKKFRENGDPIDLVKHAAGAKPPLTIISTSDELNQILQNGFYEVSTESLTLDETAPAGKIVMRLHHDSGVDVVREFTFHFDTYLIEVETRIVAPGYAAQNLNYMVLWGPSLGGEVSSHTDHFVFTGATTFLNNERVETPEDSFSDKINHRGDLEWTAF